MVEYNGTEYSFKLCTTASELFAAYNLRIEVFHEEQKFSKELEVDSYDPESAHFILVSKKDDNVAATVRLTTYHQLSTSSSIEPNTFNTEQSYEESPLGYVRSDTTIIDVFLRKLKSQTAFDDMEESPHACVKLSRLAVRKAIRGNGLGRMIVREAEKWLLKILDGNGIQKLTMILSSQMQAKNFYEKIGYVCEGEPYDEEGMLHILCKKRLV